MFDICEESNGEAKKRGQLDAVAPIQFQVGSPSCACSSFAYRNNSIAMGAGWIPIHSFNRIEKTRCAKIRLMQMKKASILFVLLLGPPALPPTYHPLSYANEGATGATLTSQ